MLESPRAAGERVMTNVRPAQLTFGTGVAFNWEMLAWGGACKHGVINLIRDEVCWKHQSRKTDHSLLTPITTRQDFKF